MYIVGTNFLKKNLLTICATAFSVGIIVVSAVTTRVDASDDVQVNLHVNGCNNNFVCEAVIGEDVNSCPNDCQAATTTPQTPTPDSDSENSRGRSGDKVSAIELVYVRAGTNMIEATWKTNSPTNGSVSWSSSFGYNLGYVQEVGYVTTHKFLITGLRPETPYSVTIVATDLLGKRETKTIQVVTERDASITAPVGNFDIRSNENGAVLLWENPKSDFDYVRIMRSEKFFPDGPYDGDLIYEGGAQSFFDTEILENVRYYYSIFTKGPSGFSPGVLQNFVLRPEGNYFDKGEEVNVFGPIRDSAMIVDIVGSPLENLLTIMQYGFEVPRANGTYYLNGDGELVIIVDKSEFIPAHADVFLSYYDTMSGDKSNDYVLKYDADRNSFVATIPTESISPSSPFILFIRNNQEIKGYLGYFDLKRPLSSPEETSLLKTWFGNDMISSLLLILAIVFLPLVPQLIFVFLKHKKHFVK